MRRRQRRAILVSLVLWPSILAARRLGLVRAVSVATALFGHAHAAVAIVAVASSGNWGHSSRPLLAARALERGSEIAYASHRVLVGVGLLGLLPELGRKLVRGDWDAQARRGGEFAHGT